jgi:hypothetical protein
MKLYLKLPHQHVFIFKIQVHHLESLAQSHYIEHELVMP